MDHDRELEEQLMNIIHGGQQADDNVGDAPQSSSQEHGNLQEHEEEDGSQYLSLEHGKQEIGDENAGEVVK